MNKFEYKPLDEEDMMVAEFKPLFHEIEEAEEDKENGDEENGDEENGDEENGDEAEAEEANEDSSTKKDVINTLFGFIITRHVKSESINRYWNQNVKLLRCYYPYAKIIIIDDNSDYRFVKADFNYKNVEVIQSEYIGRGELLPYIYYARHKWFEKAIIIHDSVFIHTRIPFGKINMPVLPIWHFKTDNLHKDAVIKIANQLNHSNVIIKKLSGKKWVGCFGVQTLIKHNFVKHIVNKYNLNNAISVVTCRDDRCALERIFGVLFCLECPQLYLRGSLFGTIFSYNFGYNYDEYYHKFKEGKISKTITKVWTGR